MMKSISSAAWASVITSNSPCSAKNGPTKVGTIQIQLKDTNTKKNRYTMNVLADDNSFEKEGSLRQRADLLLHRRTRSALELVVNKVTKTTASGYLSVPKAGGATSQAQQLPGSKRVH